MTRARLIALLVAGAALWLSGCGDDVCTRVCPSPQICVLEGGEELCLTPNCGDDVCSAQETCVDAVCRAGTTCTGCTSGQHCVSGVCVDDYTGTNACDPLRACRSGCGTSAACLAACDEDRSNSCASCLSGLDTCQRREECRESGPGAGCCESEFCSCYPTAPGCNGVAECVECQASCGDSASCFNTCSSTTLVCSVCLQPFEDCRDGASAAECTDELCLCLDPTLETACAN